MFFTKKQEIEKPTIEISGEIKRISIYTPYNDIPMIIFSIKNNSTLFYQKYISPKQSLSKIGDNITFRIEEDTKPNDFYGAEMLEVKLHSFKNHSL